MNTTDTANDAGWDTTHASRETFLAFLRAQCSPGQAAGPVPTTGHVDDASLDSAAAVLLALLDPNTSLAIEGQPATDFDWLYNATGAPVAPVSQADFVLSTQDFAGVVAAVKRGTAEQPELGATVLCVGDDPVSQAVVTLAGPGIKHPLQITVPMSVAVIEARAVANAAYPMGIDVVIPRGDRLIAFPRSTQISLEGADHVRGDA